MSSRAKAGCRFGRALILKLISTAAASAVLFALLAPASLPAGAENITLKRTGASSRATRTPAAEDPAMTEDTAGSAEDPGVPPIAEDPGPVADSGEDPAAGDDRAGGGTRASGRRLIVLSDRASTHRRHRQHCVESAWSGCGERQRTLWILD